MSEEKKTRVKLDLNCPSCGENTEENHDDDYGSNLVIHVDGTLRCNQCEAWWTTDKMREIAAQFLLIADWIEAMPTNV